MQGDVRSIKKLIAFVSIVGALAAAVFLFKQGREASEIVESATPEQNKSANDDPSVTLAAGDPDASEQAETTTDFPDAAQVMDETTAPAKTDDANYGKYVADFKEAFAESDPCRYVGIINKLTTSSLIEVFAKEPIGQSTSAGDTEML